MKKLVIIGASGHGKVIADIARKNHYDAIIFLDDNPNVLECGGYPVIGGSDRIAELDGPFVVAIGNARVRGMIQDQLVQMGKKLVTLIHPNAVIADDVVIGSGSVVMACAVINPGAILGQGCIVNTCASVDHDCILGNYVHVSVGAHLAGTVEVGSYTWIGIGATVSNNLRITTECMIGAGAVVVNNIEAAGTYVGVPARKIK